ncbi:MAG: 50S ribosomal protein L2 [Candidatus Woesearchaeota archaeon]
MGKDLIQQRRGKGSQRYRSISFNFAGKAEHRPYTNEEKSGIIQGIIMDFIHCTGHSAPLAVVEYEDGYQGLIVAPKGKAVGDMVEAGVNAKVIQGNTLPLKSIPEGTELYNLEKVPGDGGKFVRSAGTSAKLVAKTDRGITILLPSKKTKEFHPECRAIIGIIAGHGRKDKPMLKAGVNYHKRRSRNKMYPSVSGTSMNAVDHPFGGTSSAHKGKPTIAPKNAPPGRKVGKLHPRRTGKR